MDRLNALFALDRAAYHAVYAPDAAAEIARRVMVPAPPQTKATLRAHPKLLANVDVLFSGWGAPRIDAEFLAAAPRLKAIFYGAGAINGWCTPAVWARGIAVTTANDANAIPVAEYTLATTLFSLKHGWRLAGDRGGPKRFEIRPEVPGNYGAVVGLVGMGTIARLVVKMLAPFGVRVITHDPFLAPEEAVRLGVTSVGLADLFALADVVSLHAPELANTRGMVTGALLRSMRPGATFINTSRGALVREGDLAAVLRDRPDLQAVLDVTEQEPLPPSSPLIGLENLVLTPHIAGSQGRECQRMGQHMVDELDRYLAGRPLLWQVRPAALDGSVHQSTLAPQASDDRRVFRPLVAPAALGA
jgi:phosphoglycerate dehydrogenase-like enzyme